MAESQVVLGRAMSKEGQPKRGVEWLRKAYSSGRLTKENVNRRGYNKFLEISKESHRGSHLLCFIAYKVYK